MPKLNRRHYGQILSPPAAYRNKVPRAASFVHGIERPTGDFKAPKELDWDLWLGPAQERPYHPDYLPMKWRGYIDFGCGALGDFGCHTLDPAFWALNLGSPDSVLATTTNQLPEVKYDTFPTSSIITYWFPKRDKKPPVKLSWYDGGITPKWDERFDQIFENGFKLGLAIARGEVTGIREEAVREYMDILKQRAGGNDANG